MHESIHVQGDLTTNHDPEVSPLADTLGDRFAESDIKVTHVDGKFTDIWGKLGKRRESALEPTWILEFGIEGNQGWKGNAQQLYDSSCVTAMQIAEVRKEWVRSRRVREDSKSLRIKSLSKFQYGSNSMCAISKNIPLGLGKWSVE